MTSSQEARLSMYNAVISFCDANAATVATVPAFQTALNSFKDIFSTILQTAQLEAQVITGITMDKAQLRNDLAAKAVEISAAIFAYASSTGNNTLKERANYSLTDMLRLKDELLGPTSVNIANDANANAAALVSYGVTAAAITDFNTMIGSFMTAVASPRNAVTQRATYSAMLKTNFKDGNDVLKNQMDKIALQFRADQPEFYSTYKNNRIILDAATSSTQAQGVITQSGTGAAVAAVSVQVVGNTYNTVSDAAGNYKLKIQVPGSYSIKFIKSGFADKTIDNVQITLGQSTPLNAELDLL